MNAPPTPPPNRLVKTGPVAGCWLALLVGAAAWAAIIWLSLCLAGGQ